MLTLSVLQNIIPFTILKNWILIKRTRIYSRFSKEDWIEYTIGDKFSQGFDHQQIIHCPFPHNHSKVTPFEKKLIILMVTMLQLSLVINSVCCIIVRPIVLFSSWLQFYLKEMRYLVYIRYLWRLVVFLVPKLICMSV
jgi:hypothetical protein